MDSGPTKNIHTVAPQCNRHPTTTRTRDPHALAETAPHHVHARTRAAPPITPPTPSHTRATHHENRMRADAVTRHEKLD
jgi:hypothetical protein